MKNIKLNQNQIINLLSDNYLEINENESLNINDGEIMYNLEGYEFICESMEINFYENENINSEEIKNIKNIICNYFNLQQNQVIYSDQDYAEEIKFKIKITPNIEGKIVVYNNEDAISIMKEFDCDIIKYLKNDKTTIGIYKQLGKSRYYFRWVDNF